MLKGKTKVGWEMLSGEKKKEAERAHTVWFSLLFLLPLWAVLFYRENQCV